MRTRESVQRYQAIVLKALEVANLDAGRAVKVAEVARAMSPRDLSAFKRTYKKDPKSMIYCYLERLSESDLAFTVGMVSGTRYYASKRIADPAKTNLPSVPRSRRQRVLTLARRIARELGRGIRGQDIIAHARQEELEGLNLFLVSRTLGELAARGKLQIIGVVRSRAKNIFLPVEFDSESYLPKAPLARYDKLLNVFSQAWNVRVEEARAAGIAPRPLTSREIASQFRASYGLDISTSRWLTYGLGRLGKQVGSGVRCVRRRKDVGLLWAPENFQDHDLCVEQAYASNVERVAEAVRRASHRLGRPVRSSEAEAEIRRDPTLALQGSQRFAYTLQGAANRTVAVGPGERQERRRVHVIKAGSIHGRAYYVTEKPEEGRAIIDFQKSQLGWRQSAFSERLDTLQQCVLGTVAVGRALQLSAEITSMRGDLERLIANPALAEESRSELRARLEVCREIRQVVTQRLTVERPKYPNLPDDVLHEVPTWSADELAQVVRAIYPAAEKVARGSELQGRLGNYIRRINNPEYQSRRSPRDQWVATMLFDRADALIFFAQRWGGAECSSQAALAGVELGRLRDPRFVIPALNAESPEQRLCAIACLAFLWSDNGTTALAQVAVIDHEPGVRESALWAYAFSGGEEAPEFLAQRLREDTSDRTRSFIRKMLDSTADEAGWWAV